MEDLHISLTAAGLAALIALWLGARCIAVRASAKIMHGDGGNERLARRMRAQANFAEYAPVALVLVVLLDLSGQDATPAGRWALALSALAFLVGRVLHAIGMDADGDAWPRVVGMALTYLPLLGWTVWALLVASRLV
jgi:uncharacterized membrane protein YecN with MAPEG domain